MKNHLIALGVVVLVVILILLYVKIDSVQGQVASYTMYKLRDYENTLYSLKEEVESVKNQLMFKAEAYPINYSFTEQSESEFKDFFKSFYMLVLDAQNASNAEREIYMKMFDSMSGRDLLKQGGYDIYEIEIIDESSLIINGIKEHYLIKNGRLYIDDEMFGSIDEDVLTMIINEDGIEFKINYYRTTPKSNEYIPLSEKLEQISSKLDDLYAYEFY